jgi:hypothetical protein
MRRKVGLDVEVRAVLQQTLRAGERANGQAIEGQRRQASRVVQQQAGKPCVPVCTMLRVALRRGEKLRGRSYYLQGLHPLRLE